MMEPNFPGRDADGDGIPDSQEAGPDPNDLMDSDGDPDQPAALESDEGNKWMFLPLIWR